MPNNTAPNPIYSVSALSRSLTIYRKQKKKMWENWFYEYFPIKKCIRHDEKMLVSESEISLKPLCTIHYANCRIEILPFGAQQLNISQKTMTFRGGLWKA